MGAPATQLFGGTGSGVLDGGRMRPIRFTHTMKHTVVLEIAGAKFRMSSDAEEAHLRRLAETVNARIEALGPKAQRTVAPAQLLAVVALGLADDLHASEERLRVLEA